MICIRVFCIRENKISFNLVSMSGVRMEDGRTWSNSSKIFSRKIVLKNDGFETELKVLNSFEVTSSNEKTAKGSVIPQLTNPAYVDLEPPESANLHLVIFGGQAVDKYTTSDDLIIIKGPADFSGAVDVTVWTSTFMTYSQFKIPQGWSDGSNLVQRGQVPMSRSGATMGVLSNKSSHPGESSHIILVGGFHLPKPGPLKKQVSDSNIFILKYPDMVWKKLPFQEALNRNFLGIHTVGKIVYAIGGWKFENNMATKLYPLTEMTRMVLSDDYEIDSIDKIDLLPEPEINVPWVTGFSTFGHENYLYIFSGNLIENYENSKENLFESFPPKQSRSVLPPKSNLMWKVNISGKTMTAIEAPENSGGNCSSIQCVNSDEPTLVITSDPNIWLYSPSVNYTPETCELGEEYGACKTKLTSETES